MKNYHALDFETDEYRRAREDHEALQDYCRKDAEAAFEFAVKLAEIVPPSWWVRLWYWIRRRRRDQK